MKILLNRRIVFVLLRWIAEIVDLCQVLIQVLNAAGLVKVKEATACTARPSVCNDLAMGFIGIGISLKMSPNPVTFGRFCGGKR